MAPALDANCSTIFRRMGMAAVNEKAKLRYVTALKKVEE